LMRLTPLTSEISFLHQNRPYMSAHLLPSNVLPKHFSQEIISRLPKCVSNTNSINPGNSHFRLAYIFRESSFNKVIYLEIKLSLSKNDYYS
jgi:hypothetical protein